MVAPKYKGDPIRFTKFLERLTKEFDCERVPCANGSILRRVEGGKTLECGVDNYPDDTILDARLLQQICRRLNIVSSHFGVVEIF